METHAVEINMDIFKKFFLAGIEWQISNMENFDDIEGWDEGFLKFFWKEVSNGNI